MKKYQRVTFPLFPTVEQKEIMLANCYNARFAYNWGVAKIQEALDNGTTVPSAYELSREFTQLKRQPGYEWLKNKPASQRATKMAIVKNLKSAMSRFFQGKQRAPSFKTKRNLQMSYCGHEETTVYKNDRVRLENLGYVKCRNNLPLSDRNVRIITPTIVWDGFNFFLSVVLCYIEPIKPKHHFDSVEEHHPPIGIDVGVIHQMTTSDGDVFDVPDVSRIEKRIARMSRRLAKRKNERRKILKQRTNESVSDESHVTKAKSGIDSSLLYSNNYEKLNARRKKLFYHCTNIRRDARLKAVASIFAKHPSAIVIENIVSVKSWYIESQNKYNHMIQNAAVRNVFDLIKGKCADLDVPLIMADKSFPSTKMCSCCGNRLGNHISRDRVFTCSKCGYKIDRDLNAAYNLRNLAT